MTGTPRARPSLAQLAAALWAAVIVAGLVVGAIGPARWRDAVLHGGPGCPFRAVTGVDCPFCGMTRASFAMAHGDFGAALAFHPLAPLVLAGSLALLVAIALGRGEVLLRGRRLSYILGAIGVIWVVRLAAG